MNEVLEDHLQSIEDYVLIEDKIVTYKWVSKALKLHINTAKQLLHAFASKKEFDKKLFVTYLISGEGKDNSGLKFCLVNKDDVEKVKQSLEKVVCEHVYSVQRNNNIHPKDLYNADCTYELNEDDRKFCSIQKNEDIIKRSKVPENSIISPGSSNDKSSKRPQKNATQNNSEKATNFNKFNKTSESKPENTKNLQEKSTSVLEQKKSPSKETKTSPIKQGAKNKKLKNGPQTKGPTIGTFFNKQATLTANSKKETREVIVDNEKEEAKENIVEITNRRTDGDKVPKEKEDFNNKHTPVSKKKENPKKRKKRDKDYESTNKRRKRIMVASDSESSCSEMEFEEEREPSPEPEPVPVQHESEDEILPPTPVEKGRKRVRKQVDRMFADEGGFILTKKEYVYESCTDDEASTENKEDATNDKKLKTSSNKVETNDDKILKDENKLEDKKVIKKSPKKTPPKNKQQSIMNFFKKK